MREDPFPGVSDEEMEQMIVKARLGRKNGQIARMRLIGREDFADIAASFPPRDRCSRTTCSRRMKDIIAALKGGA